MAKIPRGVKKSLIVAIVWALPFSFAAKAWGFFGANSMASSSFAAASIEPPTNVSAVLSACSPGNQIGNQTVRVSWTATVSTAASGYEIARALSVGGPYQVLGTVSGRTTTIFLDSSVQITTTYFYVVRSVRNLWKSSASNPAAQATTLSAACK